MYILYILFVEFIFPFIQRGPYVRKVFVCLICHPLKIKTLLLLLYARRTTKLESSSKRYANDCYALQSFMDNDDPRVLSETIAKRRTTVKSESIDPKCGHVIYLVVVFMCWL